MRTFFPCRLIQLVTFVARNVLRLFVTGFSPVRIIMYSILLDFVLL